MAQIRFIHIGDLHGHLVPRPNVRSDGTGRLEGGLARMATLVARFRAERPDALLVNTGDTIQGSAEALFTRGQALVDVVDALGPDVFAPGNWDYLYGKERFLELFGPGSGGPGGNPLQRRRPRDPWPCRGPSDGRCGHRGPGLRVRPRQEHPDRRGQPRHRRRALLRHARGDPPDRPDRHRGPGVRGGAGRHPPGSAGPHSRGRRHHRLVLHTARGRRVHRP
ncbi:metallophosphoesterase [Tessaracoccus sp. MC1627]|uniref:metallophosphoesterase n=1 Tax=Tessaracoccus sp. MC1627 TaxID=2760312 RepID=UPI00351C0218